MERLSRSVAGVFVRRQEEAVPTANSLGPVAVRLQMGKGGTASDGDYAFAKGFGSGWCRFTACG